MLKTDFDFVTSLIKGRVVETIFHQMFEKNTGFTIIPLGYENIVPELAQYQYLVKNKDVLENIKDIPDFLLLSGDKELVLLVETKYKHTFKNEDICKIAKEIDLRWKSVYLFITSQDGFYFDKCTDIVTNKGAIKKLDTSIISEITQKSYLDIIKQFLN